MHVSFFPFSYPSVLSLVFVLPKDYCSMFQGAFSFSGETHQMIVLQLILLVDMLSATPP